MPQKSAVVRVPATSANLGPGFDTLGVALDWTAVFRFAISDAPVERPDGPVERMAVTAALALYSPGRHHAPGWHGGVVRRRYPRRPRAGTVGRGAASQGS